MTLSHHTKDASAALNEYNNYNANETKVLVASGVLNLYGAYLENNHSADVFIQMFDAAATADVTLGTTVPSWSLRLPALGGVIIDPGFPRKNFRKGLVIAVTSTRTGSSAPGANASLLLQYSLR